MTIHARLHRDLLGLLRQHCPVADERHLVLLGCEVRRLRLPRGHCRGFRITAGRALLAWLPIPLQALEPWLSRVELPPPLQCTSATAVA